MWLKRLVVSNFKSIESLDVSFGPGINAILGENGTGKTNVIKAVLKLLGPSYPGANSFQRADFLNFDESKPIEIALVLDIDGEEHTLQWAEDDRGKQRLIWDAGGYVNGDFRETLCPLHIPPSREISEMPGSNKWSPLGRIILQLSDLIESDPAFKAEFMEKSKELNDLLVKSEPFSNFRNGLIKYSGEQLGARGAGIDLDLALLDPKKILRTLQIFERIDEEFFNLSEGGQGVQSSVVMAALRAYTELSKGGFFILADEPEAYLHPLAQRALCSVFEDLARNGAQIIVTTHSPHFISRSNVTGLLKATMNDGLTNVIRFDSETLRQTKVARGIAGATVAGIEARLSKMLTVEVREALFGRTVVLCEGESESLSLEIWATQFGRPFAKDGIAVVPSLGKFSMIDLAEFYATFDTPVYVVFDSDNGKMGDDRNKHAQHNKYLLGFASEPQTDFPPTTFARKSTVLAPDFERVLRAADPDYAALERDVNDDLGLEASGQKGIRARFVALRYGEQGRAIPQPIAQLLTKIYRFHETNGTG